MKKLIKLLLDDVSTRATKKEKEVFLTAVLKCSFTDLFIRQNQFLTDDQFVEYQSLLYKREQGVPVSEIFHTKNFYGNEFFVDKTVLTPRPETEVLVQKLLDRLKKSDVKPSKIIDIGTGSGAIAITIAQNISQPVIGADISQSALDVSIRNAQNILNQESNISFVFSDLFSGIEDVIDENTWIITNLPYIPTTDVLEKEVLEYDPHLALFSGDDGMDLYRRFFSDIKNIFEKKNILFLNQRIFFEFHPPQKPIFIDVFNNFFPDSPYHFFADLNGDVRFGELFFV